MMTTPRLEKSASSSLLSAARKMTYTNSNAKAVKHTTPPKVSFTGATHEDMNRAIADAESHLLSFKRKQSVRFEEAVGGPLKVDEGTVQMVWVDPEVLADPLYVDYTVHHRKKFVVSNGQVHTVQEVRVKRKLNLYDQYAQGLLVVPKPSTKRLQAYMTPLKPVTKVKSTLRRASSELRAFKRPSEASVVSEGLDRKLPMINEQYEVHSSLSQMRENTGVHSEAGGQRLLGKRRGVREDRCSEMFLSRIRSRVLENVILRKRLNKRQMTAVS
jgi:hypothetical protein